MILKAQEKVVQILLTSISPASIVTGVMELPCDDRLRERRSIKT